MNGEYMCEYTDNLFPFLIMCYVKKESSIACFAGHFLKMYDSEGNICMIFLCLISMLCYNFLFSAARQKNVSV